MNTLYIQSIKVCSLNMMGFFFLSDQSFHRMVDNLTPAECEALRYFKSASHLVIKPADKGSAVVVMNLDNYLSEGFRQLQDPNFYTEVPTDLSESHMSNVISVVSEMCSNGEISERCKQYLCDFKYRTARFYMLPKIHKGVYPPPGRPIISGNNCPTEKISQFVDHFLKPVAQKGKSVLKDTTHFLQILQDVGSVPPGCLLVSLDVTGLYTNIPNQEGLLAAKKGLDEHRPDGKCPTNTSILRLLQQVLRKNNFTFCGKNYLQIGGTAMGTTAAPNYAINFMNDLRTNSSTHS